MRIKEETRALVPCIAFICQEVLDFDMAGTCMSTPARAPRPPDQTTEALTTQLWRGTKHI